jgi:hypothetical protein
MKAAVTARTILSVIAAVAGVLICVHQRHFVLDWRYPELFGVVFEHKCGIVMVAAMAWMLVEFGVAGWRARVGRLA